MKVLTKSWITPLILGIFGFLILMSGRATYAHPLSNRVLTLIMGTNGQDFAFAGEYYTCTNQTVNTGNGQTPPKNYTRAGTSGCGSYTPAAGAKPLPNPAPTCVDCQGPSGNSYTSGTQGDKAFKTNKVIDCTKNDNGNPSSLWNAGTCMFQQGNPNTPSCVTGINGRFNMNTACLGSFNEWQIQSITPPGTGD